MRLIRFLSLLIGVAIAVAGCAQQPVAYMAYPTAAPASGIDNVVYGNGGPYGPVAQGPVAQGPVVQVAPVAQAPIYAAPPRYAAAPVVQMSAPMSYQPAPSPVPGPAPVYAAAPTYAAAPSYAAQPSYASPPAYTPVAAAPGRALYNYAPANYAVMAAPAPDIHYTLDSGDRLRIVVFGQEGLTNSYLISAGGSIDMPLIGPVAARGATTDELTTRIAEKLRNGYIREPHVAVEVESYRPFFILGEVTAPGQYPYVANMTAETAVAIAGGFTPRGFRNNVTLTRNYAGRQTRMTVPLTFPLRPGDTINVQERWF